MTLDRIDNSRGHTKDNVLPACTRCNILRGSMPFDAWTFLMPKIEEAKKLGLFGDWIGWSEEGGYANASDEEVSA